MDEQLPETKLAMVISICVNEGFTLYHVAYCPFHYKYCSPCANVNDQYIVSFVCNTY